MKMALIMWPRNVDSGQLTGRTINSAAPPYPLWRAWQIRPSLSRKAAFDGEIHPNRREERAGETL